ncbi:hypothetical protein [Microbacterium sp. MYb64]|uniref:hypothetical protein n=1 Tax=Microbacterium sp. MYb64 TaxID=1848691 RepID=UPI000CFD7B66|nr:hypothetical protein [Microbacterium sp. MYb64]PRB08795.1 hypothetical protein CQ044_00020 [Microbacterium sp. MYb64]
MSAFASKTPRDLNHDPEPMVYPFSGQRAPYADESLGWIFSPRPEFDHVQHNAPNPILVWAREVGVDAALGEVTFSSGSYLVETWVGAVQVTSEHVVHARRVLTRLANLAKSEAA